MSSKKCTFNPEKARIAAENVRSYMKLRGQDFDEMIEESDKMLKGLSDSELKAVVKEFDAFAHRIKRFPKGQLKEAADKVDFSETKFRIPGRTVQIYKGRPSFVRGGGPVEDAEAALTVAQGEQAACDKVPSKVEAAIAAVEAAKTAALEAEAAPATEEEKAANEAKTAAEVSGGSSQRGRSRSRSANSGSTQRNSSRSRSRSRSRGRSRSRRSRHLGPQGQGIIPGTIRVAAALLIPRSKARLFQTILWLGIITMAGYSSQNDTGFVKVGLQQIQSGNCEGGWGSFDWNRHPMCSAWKALKHPIVTGMNDMYRLDPQGFFKLLTGLAGLVMPPIILNSGFYWLSYFMDYQITLMVAAFLNIEFVAPEAQEPGLFTMLALYRRMTNPGEALSWGTRLMGDNRRSHSRSRHRSRSSHRSHRSRSHRSHRSHSRSSTRNLVELARIRALQNMVRQERRPERSPSPVSIASNRRRHTYHNQNRNSRRGNNNSNRARRNSRRNSRRNNRNHGSNRRSNRGSNRGSRR